uniref:Uncharacterized protein n=1 Tax=Arundo donax TaxID=35708 RepID=A0A0A9CLW4_ARUDO
MLGHKLYKLCPFCYTISALKCLYLLNLLLT